MQVKDIIDKKNVLAPFSRLPDWITFIHNDIFKRVSNLEFGLVDQVTLLRQEMYESEDAILVRVSQEREIQMTNMD